MSTLGDRPKLLEDYGRFYGQEHFAIAFTAGIEGDNAKRVVATGWDKAKPLPDGDFAAGVISHRGTTRNIAIILRPSNLIVLECDTETDLVAIEQLDLPQTLTVRSSAPYKRHFYFRPSELLEAIPYVAFRFESGKLTADSGRYFLAPPSIHPSGAVYQFLPGLGPADTDIVELPEHTYRELCERARHESSEQRERIAIDPEAKIRAGQRRDLIFRYACMLRRWGRPQQAILDECRRFNQERCDPPVPDHLVATQVAGAMKKQGDQELEPGGDTTRPWQSVSWPVFRDTAPPAHKWLIDGLLPAGTLCFIAGPPKHGKTWIGIAQAIAVALGKPFAGYPTLNPRPVLYIALEGSQTGLRTRIGALTRGYGHDPDSDDLHHLHMLYRPRPFDLAELATADWLLHEAVDLDAALIIIDVLRAAARFQENVAEDFARIRDHLEPLLTDQRTVTLLHHFGKLTETLKERSPGERMAGTGAMYGALDVGFLITRSDDGARRLRIDIEARDFAAPDAIGIAIIGQGGGKHNGFRYDDTATLVNDHTATDEINLAAEIEHLLTDNTWRTVKEIALEDHGGIGRNQDAVRTELERLSNPSDQDGPARFTMIPGSRIGRHPTAKLWGTIIMFERLAQEVTQMLTLPESP